MDRHAFQNIICELKKYYWVFGEEHKRERESERERVHVCAHFETILPYIRSIFLLRFFLSLENLGSDENYKSNCAHSYEAVNAKQINKNNNNLIQVFFDERRKMVE